MLPPSLQKNIRELDRQISLLETECQNMESENKLSTGTSNITSDIFTKEFPNKSLISAPLCSSSLHSSRKANTLPVVSKMFSTSCIRRKTSNEIRKSGFANEDHSERNPGKSTRASIHIGRETSKHNECEDKRCKEIKVDTEGSISIEAAEKPRATTEESGKVCSESKNKSPQSKRSITSIKEVTESSEENERLVRYRSRQKRLVPKHNPKEATWSDLFCQQFTVQETREKKINKKPKAVHYKDTYRSAETLSSEDGVKDTSYNETEDKTPSDNDTKYSRRMQDRIVKKRRTRSVRTRKHYGDEISDDGKLSKALPVKQFSYRVRNQERDSNEFWSNLNSCIRTLHFLTGDLKTKTSRNRKHDILNDIQNTIMRISELKTTASPNTLKKFFEKGKVQLLEGGESNIMELKKALTGVKQFCEDIAKEKSVLTEELTSKNRLIANMKDQEKEYLTLISNLRFNLDKTKDESAEIIRLKQELVLTKSKLQEEGKVIEGLKKSHEKMQVLIENYVMENDRLRTQIKLSKLESQKYHVLLAGKEIEIKKHKEDIEQFQKRITEQLNLLKTKAKENRVEEAISIIGTQNHLFTPTEAGSSFSETTTEKHSFIDHFYVVSGKTSLTSAFTQEGNKNKEGAHTENNQSEQQQAVNVEPQKNHKPCEEMKKNIKGSFKSSKSGNSDAEEKIETKDKLSFEANINESLNNSNKLRSSIEELIQGVKRECLEKFWPSSRNSVNTSLCTFGSNSSEVLSENNNQD